MRIRVSSCGSFRKSFWAESAICGQAEGLKIPAETWEAAVEGKALAGFPAGEFRDPIFQRKPQSKFERGKPDARRQGLGVELLTKKDIRKNPLPVKVGMGIDKVAEFLRLEATAAVAHPVCADFQPPFLPRSADVIIVQESRVPEVKVNGEAVCFDMHQKGGRKIAVELKGLKPLPLIFIGRRDPDEFPGVRDGGLASRKMPDGAEFDSRADMVDHPGGKIRAFFRVVDQKSDLRQDELLFGRRREKGRGGESAGEPKRKPTVHFRRNFSIQARPFRLLKNHDK